jgi:PadR family transcriptional regulator PadR
LQALLRDPAREMYGLELSEETGLQPGTAYPILLRLEHEAWVTSRWEDVDPRAEKRPARRYYRLTAGGAVRASAALAAGLAVIIAIAVGGMVTRNRPIRSATRRRAR